MASYSEEISVHKTLTGTTVDTVTLTGAPNEVDVLNGVVVFNTTTLRGTDAIYVGRTAAFPGPTNEWAAIINADPDADYGIRLPAKYSVAAAVFNGSVCIGSASPSFGGGTKVTFIANASVVPSTNPTGGGVLYSEGGALKWRGSAGTITTIAAA